MVPGIVHIRWDIFGSEITTIADKWSTHCLGCQQQQQSLTHAVVTLLKSAQVARLFFQ